MAKTTANKLKSAALYKQEYGEADLPQWALLELDDFSKRIGFTHDRKNTLIKWIKYNLRNWTDRWHKLKELHSASLEHHILMYGETQGPIIYHNLNIKKTRNLDHSSATQARRSAISANMRRGKTGVTARSIQYWVNKGMTIDDAAKKVTSIQTTNKLDNYIKKYGEDLGKEQFLLRKKYWSSIMSDPKIKRSRSLGLWRYLERYGEIEGRKKYLEMRKTRNQSKIGKASTESIKRFSPIIKLLNTHNVAYYCGNENNKEWFIYDRVTERPYFYDLAIPSLSIIIEYHGEKFHPNPKWDTAKWNSWISLFEGENADKKYAFDTYKRQLAENANWTVFEIYSSDNEQIDASIIATIADRLKLEGV